MLDLRTKTTEVILDGRTYRLAELSAGEVEAFDTAIKSGEAGFGPIIRALLVGLKPVGPFGWLPWRRVTEKKLQQLPPRVLRSLFDELLALVRIPEEPGEDGVKAGELKAV
jgi:hypothetical protein